MKNGQLDFLKKILEDRLLQVQDLIYHQSNSAKESSLMKLKDIGDINSTNAQLNIDEAILVRYKLEMQDIEISLKKFLNQTYGVCEMCDDDIDINRLKSKPHAKYCIACREIYEKGS